MHKEHDERKAYERPAVVDYGSLEEMTAGHGGHHFEDAIVKNHDASHRMI